MVRIPSGYTKLHEISSSATTAVYAARRDADGAPVVIKTSIDDSYPIEQLARLQHEFELLRQVDSPHVVKAYELVDSHPGLSIVLEDRGGQPLAQRRSTAAVPIAEALRITADIVAGLGALHRCGIVHRAINPWNILHNPVTRETQLIDLSHASRLRRGRLIEANPYALDAPIAYISPEQTGRTSRLIDYRTDFYSLGVTLYELLTGTLPFDSADPLEIIHAHIARRPLPPATRNREVPPLLSELVMHLLEKSPEQRYQSADGIAADLETCAAQLEPGPAPLPAARIGERDTPLWFEIPNKLYGREKELAAIQKNLELVVAGAARVVLLAGLSGSGKSSLVGELGGLLTQHRIYFGYGKFEQFASSTPHSAIIHALRVLVRRILTEPEATLATWKQRIERTLGRNIPLIIEVIPELETLFGPQPPLPGVGPLEARARLSFAVRAFLQSIARPEHALALFLDDLQWADTSSLQLIESLFLDGSMQYLLLVGTYRDNEIDPASPAALTLRRLQQEACCKTFELTPLTVGSVAAMLSEALAATPQEVAEIAELCVERCAGNPMLIRELINSLVDAEIIRRTARPGSPRSRRWEWDIAVLRRSPLTDNAARLISQRIERLPEPAHRLVLYAACIGPSFHLSHLAHAAEVALPQAVRLLRDLIAADIFYVSPEDEIKLSSLASESRVLSQFAGDTDVTLSFRHDLLLQAAYEAIRPEEQARMHLRVGRAMTQGGAPADEDIFAVLSQLNRARPLMQTREQCRELARLNLSGGKRAAAASAHEAALGYFSLALELLDGQSWEDGDNHDLLAELHVRAAEAACVAGALERSDALIAAALAHASSPEEEVGLLKVKVIQRTLAGRCAEALRVGSEALGRLGAERMPEEDELRSAVDSGLQWLDEQFRTRPIVSLRALPTADTPVAHRVGEMLSTMNAPAYFTSPDHVAWLATAIVKSTLRHGSTPASAMGYVILGNIYSNLLGRYEEGRELGQLALALADQFNDGVARCRTRLIFANNYFCWTRPIRESFAINDQGFRAGIESGDLSYAGYFQMFRLFHPLSAGEPLARIEALIPEHASFCHKTGNQLMCDVIEGLQALLANLRGATPGPLCFDQEGRTEAELLDGWRARQSGMALGKFHAVKSMALYLHGDSEGASRSAAEAQALQPFTLGQYTNLEALHYGSLSLIRLLEKAAPAERAARLAEVRRRQQQLKMWAELCPANLLHCYLLVEAELDRVSGNRWEAAREYHEAIQLARDSGFQQAAALANELAGRFWLEQGFAEYGDVHLRQAQRGYAAWGALRKVGLLEAELGLRPDAELTRSSPGLPALPAEHAPPPPESGDDSRAAPTTAPPPAASRSSAEGLLSSIDLSSVLKAARAISGEIVLERLTSTLMNIVVENTGAERGLLFLPQDGGLRLSGAYTAAGLSDNIDYPAAVINYVARTSQSVVLHDVVTDLLFATDPYIGARQPKAVLCAPLIEQGRLEAIIYLENNLTHGAFTQERLQVVSLLGAQAALSFKNAALYTTLEQKVAARTQELQEKNTAIAATLAELRATQKQLVQQEKLASLGALTAGVAHEIRNPLNFISNFAECVTDFVESIAEGLKSGADVSELMADLRESALKIQHHSQRADAIIDNMLMHSRQSSGEREETDLNILAKKSLELAYHGMRVKDSRFKVTCETVLDPELPPVSVIQADISRVLINILSNAFYAVRQRQGDRDARYTPKVRIQTRKRGENVEVVVHDNGTGIAPELVNKIYTPFFTTKPAGQGTGLGLSISNDIIHGYQGEIRLDTVLGEFAEFTIVLPRARRAT